MCLTQLRRSSFNIINTAEHMLRDAGAGGGMGGVAPFSLFTMRGKIALLLKIMILDTVIYHLKCKENLEPQE